MKQCAHYRDQFSAYLDGVMSGASMHEIATHLEACQGCNADFAQWRNAQRLVASIGPAKAPENLALRLRVAVSQQAANTVQERFARGRMRWKNTLSPMIWQVTAGFASTVALVGAVALLIGMFASPEPLLARDEPLGMATNPRLLYPSPGTTGAVGDHDNPVVVQAYVNAAGQVYDYAIVSGNVDFKTRSQVTDMLLYSVFTPAQVFGQPVRGTVVLSFAGVSVRG